MNKQYTLLIALKDFTEWGSAVYAARTVDTYTDLIRRFITFTTDKPVTSVTLNHITKYILHLKKRGYADSSVAYSIISLRVLFKFLYLQRKVDWDYRLIRIPKFVSKHFPTIRKDEALALMKSIKQNDFLGLRDGALIRFLFATGVRVSELCDLTCDEIDTDEMSGEIVTKKSQKRRVIFWDVETNELLKKYLGEREVVAKDNFVFVSMAHSRSGHQIRPRTVQRIVTKYRGSKHITPHSFRSGLITDLMENDVNLRVIQDCLGHGSMTSLEPYARVTNKHLEKEYRRVRG